VIGLSQVIPESGPQGLGETPPWFFSYKMEAKNINVKMPFEHELVQKTIPWT